VRRDLDALRLAARQRRRRLAEPQVAEADLVEHLQAAQHLRRAAEERQRLAHRHVEHLVTFLPRYFTSSTCGLKRLPSH
jgi:acyl transferase domain-containing protein